MLDRDETRDGYITLTRASTALKMALKAISPELAVNKPGENPTALARLDAVESSLLTLLQDVRSIRTDIEKQVSKSTSLEPLLEAEDVAKILGVEVGYVYHQAKAGKMPSIKLGKYRKFSPSKLKQWLERNIS